MLEISRVLILMGFAMVLSNDASESVSYSFIFGSFCVGVGVVIEILQIFVNRKPKPTAPTSGGGENANQKSNLKLLK